MTTNFDFKQLTKKPLILVAIGVIIFCFLCFCTLLVALFIRNGNNNLSDSLAISIIQEHHSYTNQIRNIQIISKGKCDLISATAKANGISEVWIVNYSYEYDVWGDNNWGTINVKARIIKQNNSWEFSSGSVCP